MEKRNSEYLPLTDGQLADMVGGYLECAAWCDINSDSEGLELQAHEQGATFSETAREAAKRDCRAFAFQINASSWDYAGYDLARLGHDFWLSRNGHGAGFFDRDELPKAVRDFAQDKARRWGSTNVFAEYPENGDSEQLQLALEFFPWDGAGSCWHDSEIVELSNGALAVTFYGPIAPDAHDDSALLAEAIEEYAANGGPYFVGAEVTGDLTDSPIIVSQLEIADDGVQSVPGDARKWWRPNYAVRSIAQDLNDSGFAIFNEVQ